MSPSDTLTAPDPASPDTPVSPQPQVEPKRRPRYDRAAVELGMSERELQRILANERRRQRRAAADPVETTAGKASYAKTVARMIARHGARVAAGDPEDLTGLVRLRGILDKAITHAVKTQRANPNRDGSWTWGDIASAATKGGWRMSEQYAQKRWGTAAEVDLGQALADALAER